MSYKPRNRVQTRVVTGRRVASVLVAVLLATSAWFAYETYFVKPAPEYATVYTTKGSFEIELFPAAAPATVANFVNLADSGFYNDQVWHRIFPGLLIQTGDPNTRGGLTNRSTWGVGGSSQTVPLEIDRSLHNYQGYVGMARKEANNSGTSQFYINLSNSTLNRSLDGNYTVFGKVVSGWSVVQSIADVPTYAYGLKFAGQPIDPVFVNVIVISKSP
ncbi:MAG: peptidylprolyl isomerase [Thaumarchaeota archaeon]|nr:peptidylprolyl isomerase [Nitrososphaerota archaeon]